MSNIFRSHQKLPRFFSSGMLIRESPSEVLDRFQASNEYTSHSKIPYLENFKNRVSNLATELEDAIKDYDSIPLDIEDQIKRRLEVKLSDIGQEMRALKRIVKKSHKLWQSPRNSSRKRFHSPSKPVDYRTPSTKDKSYFSVGRSSKGKKRLNKSESVPWYPSNRINDLFSAEEWTSRMSDEEAAVERKALRGSRSQLLFSKDFEDVEIVGSFTCRAKEYKIRGGRGNYDFLDYCLQLRLIRFILRIFLFFDF